MQTGRIARHAIIRGTVQGVWYRAWTEKEATARGLAGWVRNRRDGTVEALFAGPQEAVEAMLTACRSGPPLARVSDVYVKDAELPEESGFSTLPTA